MIGEILDAKYRIDKHSARAEWATSTWRRISERLASLRSK